MKTRLILFSKYPQLGKVKTRLVPYLSESQALSLYQKLLHYQLENLESIAPKFSSCIYSTIEPQKNHFFSQKFHLKQQIGSDLGERMYNALEQELHNYSKVILYGVDCPEIDEYCFNQVSDLLEHYEVVLIPAMDGGYVLIGSSIADKRIFESIEWGSEKVLGQTVEKLKQLNYHYCVLEPKLDIDEPEDLKLWKKSNKKPRL